MTRLKLSDLPPNLRAQVAAEHGVDDPGPTKPGKSRAGISEHKPCHGHCGCGQPFASAAAWEKHAKTEGHSRWAIDLVAPGLLGVELPPLGEAEP